MKCSLLESSAVIQEQDAPDVLAPEPAIIADADAVALAVSGLQLQPLDADPLDVDPLSIDDSESSDDPVEDTAIEDTAVEDTAVEDTAGEDTASGFASLGLGHRLLATLDSLGYQEPTPIQAEAIPHLLSGVDLLGQAATGTGKTAAFALPTIEHIVTGGKPKLQVLVLTPTRELAMQVSEAMTDYGKSSNVKVTTVYGGQPIGRQLDALRRGVHVVVATPGRAIDHLKRGSLDLDNVSTVILDEADEMLDMGFTEDIELILENTPPDRQTVMFSATMPPRIHSIAKRHQRDPVMVKIKSEDRGKQHELIDQQVYVVHRNQKAAALGRILDLENPTSAIVFCKTRTDVDELTVTMSARGYRAEALHGGMDQAQRDRVMARLREGTAELLIATDVAARGLDVDTLTHVVNYDIPTAPESYVHRIGRVGRAGRRGVAITLASPRQRRLLSNIERLTKQKIDVHKVPTAADLRQRQIETTTAALREALSADELEDFQQVLHGLKGEASDRDIALAALMLAHKATHSAADEADIADASKEFGNDDYGKKGQRGDRGRDRNRDGRGKKNFDRNGSNGSPRQPDPNTGYVYIGVGARGGVRPGDLVGAIANETNLSGRQIGPIRISDHYSVVGVPDKSVDDVIHAIKKSTVKGKKAKARRYTD